MSMRRLGTVVGVLGILGLLASVGLAADMGIMAASQMKAATVEAGKAASAGSLKAAQEHLQAVVNCIEGPKGAMFKKMMGKMMSACEGKGNGLLGDAMKAGGKYAGAVAWIQAANDNAALGLKATALARARAAGYAAQSLLTRAEKSMMMAR